MKQKIRIAVTAALASGISLCSNSLLADHGSIGFGLGTAAPIITSSAITLPASKALVGVTTQYTDYNEFSTSRLIELNERLEGEERHVHSIESLLTTSLIAAYGVTDDITLGLRFPYVWRNNVREVPHHDEEEHHDDEEGAGEEAPHVQNLGDPNGIGDTTFFGQWRFFNTEDNLTHVALLGAVKMPTGRTDRVTARNEEGEREIQDVHFQPGSGSWDGSLGLAFTQGLGDFSFDSNVLYTWVTKGDRDVDLGDVFTYNAALSWSPGGTLGGGLQASSNFNLWTLMVELNGEWRDFQTERGLKDVDEGGHILYVSPGARFAGGENWNLALSFGVPIVTDLNGHQVEPDYRITSRINVTF
ncbi:transporter [Methylocaldum sp.]|uniref:transporter n=1 Tax=Methylocaldum sp. TaxID=1969727 RepID=UPI002D57F0D9|nr:transporter [Methylocaldum sp.]HYE34023.1 transporter [Methylocaldum sp.]